MKKSREKKKRNSKHRKTLRTFLKPLRIENRQRCFIQLMPRKSQG
jgi:hypothetical protein